MHKRGFHIVLTAQEYEIEILDGKEVPKLIGDPKFLASTFTRAVGQKALDCFALSGADCYQKERLVPMLQEQFEKEQAKQVENILDMVEI